MGLPGNSKRTTNSTGDISEAAIIARLLQLGYVVLTVSGGNQRYDLVIEDAEGHFWRVQCKTARIEDNGTVWTEPLEPDHSKSDSGRKE